MNHLHTTPSNLPNGPLSCQRSLFDIPADITYLNSAYMTPLPEPVRAAAHTALSLRSQPWRLKPADFFEPAEAARRLAASLFNAPVEQMAFVSNVASAMAILERQMLADLGSRFREQQRNIVVLGEQFPSNIFVWRNLTAHGFKIITVSPPDASNESVTDPNSPQLSRAQRWNQAVLKAIDANTALVAMEHAHWTDGTLFDLSSIAARCKEVNARLALDLTQTVGIQTINVKEWQPDLVVAHPYKSMLCNYGLAIAYFAPSLLGNKPLEEHWLMRAGAEDFSRLVDYRDEYAEGARKFDSSNRASSHLILMLNAALELNGLWQPERIANYLQNLTSNACERLVRAGYHIASSNERTPNIFGVRGFINDNSTRSVRSIAAKLQSQNIFVSVRGSAMRVSPHVYNNADDLERFVNCLIEA